MTLRVSPVISADAVDRGAFSARRVEPTRFEGMAGRSWSLITIG